MNFKNIASIFLTFIILFGFWVMLSGQMDPLHLGFGIVCSLLVALFSHDLLIRDPAGILHYTVIFIRFIPFLGWLVFQIIKANLQVARLVLKSKIPLSPGIIKLNSRLKKDIALTTMATSITLTPGTMTVDVVDGDFYIHCLVIEDEDKVLAEEREFEIQVAHLFGDKK